MTVARITEIKEWLEQLEKIKNKVDDEEEKKEGNKKTDDSTNVETEQDKKLKWIEKKWIKVLPNKNQDKAKQIATKIKEESKEKVLQKEDKTKPKEEKKQEEGSPHH